jgi:hypothetical protein
LQSSVNKTKEKNDEAMDEFKGVFLLVFPCWTSGSSGLPAGYVLNE